MIVFRLKSDAYLAFLTKEAGVIKCRELFTFFEGEEIKITNADRPNDPPLFASVRGTHYERDPDHKNKVIACYVIE